MSSLVDESPQELYDALYITGGTFIFFVAVFYFWPAPPKVEKKKENKGANKGKTLSAGEVAGDYNEDWTKTFDMAFLLFMMGTLAILIVATYFVKPELFTNSTFWIYQLPKPAVMMGVSCLCGLLCRCLCPFDEAGYIITAKTSWFKVNYTRKVQHFAAYFIPLVIQQPDSCNCSGTLETAWGQWITLLCFLVMIKPLREAPCIGTFFMLQFNSLDRPEDRPYTLKWIIAGNILPGFFMILFFRYLFAPTNQEALVLIFVFVTGLGDGLAEPVGITFGRHKYKTRSCTEARKYERSYEGSACVFLSGMLFTAMEYHAFKNSHQFWATFIVMGPVMAVAEATSPHTMDTPFLMGLGGLIIYMAITFL
jgi:dolichol kinase